MKKKELCYIAYPYRSSTHAGVGKNFQEVMRYARIAWEKGFIPVVPHINSAAIFGMFDGDDKTITEYDLYLLSRCDRMWVCGYIISRGMQIEIDFCKKNKIKVEYHA